MVAAPLLSKRSAPKTRNRLLPCWYSAAYAAVISSLSCDLPQVNRQFGISRLSFEPPVANSVRSPQASVLEYAMNTAVRAVADGWWTGNNESQSSPATAVLLVAAPSSLNVPSRMPAEAPRHWRTSKVSVPYSSAL